MKASIGGILGLGLGFSMISAIELCYFLCCGWCSRKRRRMSESTDNLVLLGDVQFPIKHKRSHQPKKIHDIPAKVNSVLKYEFLSIRIHLIYFYNWISLVTEKNHRQYLGQYYLRLIQ